MRIPKCGKCNKEAEIIEIKNVDYYWCKDCKLMTEIKPEEPEIKNEEPQKEKDPNDSIEWGWGTRQNK